MGIYHFSVKVLSRAKGQSAPASAAYRSASRLHDERLDQTFDFTHKRGVEHTEILAPEGAPHWVFNRELLWNTVERSERRKDAQLAREAEIALPVELTKQAQVDLLRDFVHRAFVSKGMVADIALHRDNPKNPHAHVLLTTRTLTAQGFGPKRRDWNDTRQLLTWRQQWAEAANEHLARAGHDLRIDHRSLAAQGLDLTPGQKIGISAQRQNASRLPQALADKVAEQRAIARENGERILEDPTLALKAITHHQATFTRADIARWLHGRTDGAEQFDAAYLRVTTHRELVRLGPDDRGHVRYTTQEMLDLEHAMLARSQRLAERSGHAVSAAHQLQVLATSGLSDEQRAALHHVTDGTDLAVVVGVAGAGKSTMLDAARRAWESEGLTVKGAALAGIAAENLNQASGIPSRTLASWELAWEKGYEKLTRRDVFVIDEAGLIGTRQLARVLEHVESAGAKAVLVGDPEQLQAIEAGAPFRGIADTVGMAELTEVRRQRHDWQKQATRQLSRGQTTQALNAYENAGFIQPLATREAARERMLSTWREAGQAHGQESRLMLAYTRADVHALNTRARELRQAAGELGAAETIETARGMREFAVGDRLYFLKNDRGLQVKNGSLGTVEKIERGVLQVRLDGEDEHRVVVDSHHYTHLDHGYAATIHKSQGATVDRTFVLATPHFDRHSTYVALSRHRESAMVFYGEDDFTPHWSRRSAGENFAAVLSRVRPKDLATDYPLRGGVSLERLQLERSRTESQPPEPQGSARNPAEELPEAVPPWEAFVRQTRSDALAAWHAHRAAERHATQNAKTPEPSRDYGLEL